MNIIERMDVRDPTLEGRLERPYLHIEVNQEPELTEGPDEFVGGWSLSKYGALFRYEKIGNEVSAAEFNTRFPDIVPLVDVEVSLGGITWPFGHFALSLRRARSTLRRFCPQWRLLASDHDVQQRFLLWTPTQANAGCRKWFSDPGVTCGQPTRGARVRIGEVDLPLCSDHMSEFQREQKEFQAAFKG